MKKRMGAVLLAICMLVGLLPTTTVATDTTASDSPWKLITPDEHENDQTPYYDSIAVKSFEELKKAVETVPDDIKSGYEPTISIWVKSKWGDEFTWPAEGGELTIDFGGDQKPTTTCMPNIELYASTADGEEIVTWEIPENVTITCYENMWIDTTYGKPLSIVVDGTLNLASEIRTSSSDEKSEIVVNGTLNCMRDANSWSDASLETISSITVNDGGTMIAEYADFAQEVILNKGASMQMGETNYVFDLTVHSGAEFKHTSDYAWYLFGTLTLDDGVKMDVGNMTLWTNSGGHTGSINAAIVTGGSAVLDGTISLEGYTGATAALTLQGDLTTDAIVVRTNKEGDDEANWGKAELTIPAGSHVKLPYINVGNSDNGMTVNVAGTLEFNVSGGASNWKSGNLVLDEGTVILRPSAHLFNNYTNEAVTGKITGNGTIKMYARVCPDDFWGWGWYPGLFGWNCETDETDPLYEQGYIASTVTLWRNWDETDLNCTHAWDAGTVTKEPTDTTTGQKLFTCTICGTEKIETIPVTGSGGTDSGDSGSGDSGSGGSGSDSGSVTDGYQVTFNYPEDLCSMSAEAEDGTVYHSGDTVPKDTYLSYDITGIASGYRIKSVTVNGEDWTKNFVNGAYGSIGTDIDEDTTITVELELIPEVLPTVQAVTLYMDSAFTELAPEQVTVDSRTRFFGKATYSDGEEYPAYYIGGVWEYSVDGINWTQDTNWGRNRFDYWPGWSYREDSSVSDLLLNGSYDLRLRVTPNERYATGEAVLSNVIHINGGAASGTTCEHANTTTINQKDATCGAAGYTGDTYCNDCKKTIASGTTIPATGEHQWNNGVITTQPTVDNEGVKTFTCTVCGDTKTEAVAKLAAQEVSWTVPAVNWTYGKVGQVNNDAYNDTEDGGKLTYSSSNTAVATVNEHGRVTVKGAGTATITVTAAAVPNRYAETSASYTLTVSKAPLTVTAKDHTIAYGQVPANNGFTVTGLVNSEDESVLTGTAGYTYSYEQYDKVGTYAITLSGLSAKNYDITFAPGVLTVEQATAYTITPGKLEQVAGHTSAVTASIAPYDSTAAFKVEYQVAGDWTETVPVDAGSYAVRISLTASDNIVLDGKYTECTLVVNHGVTVDGADADAAVSVEDGKASLILDDPGEVAGNANGDVSIDLGGVSGVEELELPAALLTGLSENANADSLTVTTEDASVTLSGAVVDTVAGAVKSGEDTVTVRLTSVEKSDLNDKQQAALDSIGQDAVIVEVSLIVTHTDGSETELHELGGNAEITVPYDGPVPEGKYIVVSYVSDDGSVSYVRASYNRETKQVSFKTNHFSHYVLALSGKNTYDVTVTDGSGSGTYLEGSTVTVQADSKSGYTFAKWEVVSGTLTLTDANNAKTTFTMPAGNVTLKAVYTRNSSGGSGSSGGSSSGGSTSVEPAAPVNPFTDVPAGSYYVSAVLWAVEQGITTGVTETSFVPDGACARAQLVTFLWRAAGCPAADAAMSFSDVAAGSYCCEAVRWAASHGIVKGYSSGLFGTQDTVTREQVVTILYRYARAMGMDVSVGADTNILSFRDVSSVHEYAVEAMQWAVGAGIVQGSNGVLMPQQACTRAQIVTMLYRLLGTKG